MKINNKRVSRQLIECETILETHIYDKGLITRNYNELLQFNKKINKPILKIGDISQQHFSKNI